MGDKYVHAVSLSWAQVVLADECMTALAAIPELLLTPLRLLGAPFAPLHMLIGRWRGLPADPCIAIWQDECGALQVSARGGGHVGGSGALGEWGGTGTVCMCTTVFNVDAVLPHFLPHI